MPYGIDLGSRNVKLVFVGEAEQEILEKVDKNNTNAGSGREDLLPVRGRIYETAGFYRQYGSHAPDGLRIDFTALGLGEIKQLTATGYGRNTLALASTLVIPELKAHVLGAVWQTGLQNFTLLDLGGQDSKVIKVRKGKMVDFQTNDKCAASTGRYLENMAVVLGIDLETLASYDAKPVELNATCAIFGESELIGRMVEGYTLPELAAGVNYTIYQRLRPMLRDLASQILVFTGGVALGPAIGRLLSREMGLEVVIPPYPQLNGAIGCAVYEQENK